MEQVLVRDGLAPMPEHSGAVGLRARAPRPGIRCGWCFLGSPLMRSRPIRPWSGRCPPGAATVCWRSNATSPPCTMRLRPVPEILRHHRACHRQGDRQGPWPHRNPPQHCQPRGRMAGRRPPPPGRTPLARPSQAPYAPPQRSNAWEKSRAKPETSSPPPP